MKKPHGLTFLPILLVSMLLTAVGCTLKVESSDLVGNWYPTPETLSAFHSPTNESARPELDLSKDGTFFARNLACMIVYSGSQESTCSEGPVTGKGRWRISRDQSYIAVNLSFTLIRRGNLIDTEPTQTNLIMVDKEKDFYLYTWEDNEEASHRLQWVRQKDYRN